MISKRCVQHCPLGVSVCAQACLHVCVCVCVCVCKRQRERERDVWYQTVKMCCTQWYTLWYTHMPMAKSVTYKIHRMEQLTLIVMPLVMMIKEATQSTDT